MDDIMNSYERRVEVADRLPARAFSPDEVTKVLRQLFKLFAALQAECETLNQKIELLKTHHHVTGDMIYGLPDQTLPDKPATD